MIAPRNNVVAAITNVTWDLGTTAISSNISSPGACKGKTAKAAAFIHNSYESVEKDLARGSGEYLDALMSLASCEKKNREALSNSLRDAFASSVSKPDYTHWTRYQKSENLYNILNEEVNGQFVDSCSDKKG